MINSLFLFYGFNIAWTCNNRWLPFRCSLLMALTICLGGVYICEQPRQSLLYRHPRFRWLTVVSTVPWYEQNELKIKTNIFHDYFKAQKAPSNNSSLRFFEAAGGCGYSARARLRDMWRTRTHHGWNVSTLAVWQGGNQWKTNSRTQLHTSILFPESESGMEQRTWRTQSAFLSLDFIVRFYFDSCCVATSMSKNVFWSGATHFALGWRLLKSSRTSWKIVSHQAVHLRQMPKAFLNPWSTGICAQTLDWRRVLCTFGDLLTFKSLQVGAYCCRPTFDEIPWFPCGFGRV